MTASTPADGQGSVVAQGVILERLRWWDLDEVLALERDLFDGSAWTAGQFWAELARVPESRWYTLARRGGRIVGYAGVFLVGPQADVQTIAVAGDEQGRGTGRLLLEALIAQVRAAGVRVLHLEVRADNISALALYERLGFVADGRRRDYYGRGHDGVLMSLRLAAQPHLEGATAQPEAAAPDAAPGVQAASAETVSLVVRDG